MEVGKGMKDLADQILASHEVRINTLLDLKNNTMKTLQDFAKEREVMGREQSRNLLDFTNSLSGSVDSLLDGFRKGHKAMGDEQSRRLRGSIRDLTKSTSDMRSRFLKEHRHVSREQAKFLADFAGYITRNVHDLLKGFHADHQQMSDEQAKNLADFMNNLTRDMAASANSLKQAREKAADELRKHLSDEVKRIRTYTTSTLNEFEKEHGKMSASLRKDLDQYVNNLTKDVSSLIRHYREDMKEAKDSWSEMSMILSSPGTRMPVPSLQVREDVSTVDEAIEKEEAEERQGLPESEIEEKVLGYINQHPEGVKVGSMETALGIPRMRLGMKAKKLLEDGKVWKEDNVYYPLARSKGPGFTIQGPGFSTETH